MPTTTPNQTVEKALLILLIVITVTQFAVWGQQSMTYILTSIFPVADAIPATFLDVVIGFGAMLASALVFAGAVMWWKHLTKAADFVKVGAIIFMVKNVLDILNEIILFGIVNTGTVTMSQINTLAGVLGEQFFQLAFWIFIFYYFKNKIAAFKTAEEALPSIPPSTPTPST